MVQFPLYFLQFPFVFLMCFERGQGHIQIKQNCRNLFFIYIVMTSTQKVNKVCVFNFFVICQEQRKREMTRRVSLVSNSDFFYENEE